IRGRNVTGVQTCALPIFGSSGLIAVVIGNLIYTVIILPLALAIVQSGTAQASPLKALGRAVVQPLVVLPILGAILAVMGFKLPRSEERRVGKEYRGDRMT